MEAKKISVGNYLLDRGGKLLKIDFFERDKVCMRMFVEGNEVHPLTESFDYLTPVPLTEEWLDKMDGINKISTFTVIPTYLFDLGRNRRLSITIEGGNQCVWLQEYSAEDYRITTDLICIFNGDYDGRLYVHYLQNLISSFGMELEIVITSKNN